MVFLKWGSRLKQYYFSSSGLFAPSGAGNYMSVLVAFLVRACDLQIRLGFRHVQPHSLTYRFGWSKGEVPENSLKKVLAAFKFDMMTQNFRKS